MCGSVLHCWINQKNDLFSFFIFYFLCCTNIHTQSPCRWKVCVPCKEGMKHTFKLYFHGLDVGALIELSWKGVTDTHTECPFVSEGSVTLHFMGAPAIGLLREKAAEKGLSLYIITHKSSTKVMSVSERDVPWQSGAVGQGKSLLKRRRR